MFMVVSYKSDTFGPVKVLIDGIYETMEEAKKRQLEICGGRTGPTYSDNNSVQGRHSVISWIKNIPTGDLDKLDIYMPDPKSK
uniref:Uncharacterized protein n=1 Tax=viral metagenome TaxID=1070528 RepID=A0A6C0LLS7_9ZZZZ